MSRQSKQANRLIIARGFTELRKRGEHGPDKTATTHGKRVGNRLKHNVAR